MLYAIAALGVALVFGAAIFAITYFTVPLAEMALLNSGAKSALGHALGLMSVMLIVAAAGAATFGIVSWAVSA